MAKTYWVESEGAGILNPGERPFRSLDKALALAAKAAEDCSWECLTPPAPDNELHTGRGNFRCGVTACAFRSMGDACPRRATSRFPATYRARLSGW